MKLSTLVHITPTSDILLIFSSIKWYQEFFLANFLVESRRSITYLWNQSGENVAIYGYGVRSLAVSSQNLKTMNGMEIFVGILIFLRGTAGFVELAYSRR